MSRQSAALAQVIESSPTAQNFGIAIALRQRHKGNVMRVYRLKDYMESQGASVDMPDLYKLLGEMSNLGYLSIISTQAGRPTAFKWNKRVTDIGEEIMHSGSGKIKDRVLKLVTKESSTVAEPKKEVKQKPQIIKDKGVTVLVYNLNGKEFRMDVPKDFDREELEQVIKYLENFRF